MAARATSSSMIVSEVLNKDNYENWSVVMKNYLRSRNLWNVISGKINKEGDDENAGALHATQLRRIRNLWNVISKKINKEGDDENAEALHAIQISCGSDALSKIREISEAREAWNRLNALFNPEGNPDPEHGIGNLELHRLVEKGKWNAANDLMTRDDNAVFECNPSGRTALHVAVIAGQVEIVKKLVNTQEERLVRMQDRDGHTALALVARLNGNTEMAECLVDTDNDLLDISTNDNQIPLLLAAAAGHKKMTRYLFLKTHKGEWTKKNSLRGLVLLKHCITSEVFDVALEVLRAQIPLIEQWEQLPSEFRAHHRHPLNELARMPSVFPSGFQFKWWHWKRIIYEILIPRNHDLKTGTIKTLSKEEQRDEQDSTPVHESLQSVARLLQLKRFGESLRKVHVFIQDFLLYKVPAIKKIHKMKLTHYQVLQILVLLRNKVFTADESQLREISAYDAVLQAAKYGITEFIESMRKANPDLLWVIDKNKRSVFSHAILNRQGEVLKLLVDKTAQRRKEWLISPPDAFGNNMLHLAAELGPSSDLNRRSGAALQMQREIQWFKEVEKIAHPNCRKKKNADGKKPQEVFTKSHEDLVKEGAKWAKDTATSFTIVCTLIITIMFAAAFTVPGGNHQETGFPIFINKKWFEVFALAGAISLVASSASVLISIGILTSRYAEQDFQIAVPLKLLFALLFLFTSVVAMMAAFCAGIAMMLEGYRGLVITAVSLAGIPIFAFVLTQLPLFIEIYASTIGWKGFTFMPNFFYYLLISIFFGPYIILVYIIKKLSDFCSFVSQVFT